jgi:hypothetical protein
MVACLSLTDASLILPSSSGAPALACTGTSPVDKRTGDVDDRRGNVRPSPVLRYWRLEAEWDLGTGATIMGGANKVGEGNGSDPKVMLFVIPMPGGFTRGGGTWVFLGSTSIWKDKRQAKASFPALCSTKSRGTWSEWSMLRRESNEPGWRGAPVLASSIAPRSPALNRQLS